MESTKRNLMAAALLAFALAIAVVGCKKKEEPAPAPTMEKAPTVQDVEKMAAETQEAATETAAKAKETVEAAAAAVEQTTCPIMDGNKIDKNVFVEYQGKKVYFCCAECKAKFEAAPEKYIANLPQFAK